MSGPAWTPGPWEIEDGGQWGAVSADGRDEAGWIVCDLGVHVDLSCNNRELVSQAVLDEIDANGSLIAAAPDLYDALEELADVFAHDGENSVARFDRLAAMFRKDTGYIAPGKDQPMSGVVAQADRDELNAIYDRWYAAKVDRARAALAKASGK